MNKETQKFSRTTLAALGLVAILQTAGGQTFQYKTADLILGFRKTGANQENYEAVVDIGQASNYLFAAAGTTFAVPNYTPAQLVTDSFSSFNNLTWSVVGYYTGTAYPGYTNYTLWMTVPRTTPSVQSTAATRLGYSVQKTIKTPMVSILGGAQFVSTALGTSNQDNTVTFVRESIAAYSGHLVTTFMGSVVD